MNYSDKYEVTNTITLSNIVFNTTDKLKNLYTVNEKFDNSILFTSSEILESLNLYPNFNSEYDGGSVYDFFTYVDRTTHKFKNVDKLNSEKLKVGICFIFSQNYSNPLSYFNWGVYTNQSTGVHYDSENFVFIKNIDLKKLVFSASASNIGDFSDIVSDGEGWGKLGTDYISINAYYWDGSRYQTVYLRPAIVIYDNDTLLQVSAIQPILSQNFFGGEFYNNFSQSYLFNTMSNNLKNYEKKSQMIIYPEFDINGIDLTPDTNPNLFKNDYVKLTTTKSSSTTTIDTYLSKSFISKILASIGCYFTDYNLYNDRTKNFDWLLQNGHLWLGEMVDGKTTGNWLHSVRDIYLAENYEINSENENYKPNGEDDKDEIAIQTVGVGQQEAKFLKYYLMSSSDLETLSNDMDETIVSNPIQYIISLQEISSIVVPYLSPITNVENIHLGGWVSPNATGLRINSSTGILFAGSTRVDRVFNNFLDYSPYTILNLYVPFCGTVELPTDVAMGKEVSVNITFDMDTFDCCAMIFIDGGYFVQINGNLSKNYSVTQSNFGLHKLQVAGSMASVVSNLGAIAFNPVSALALPSTIGGMINSFGKSFTTLKGGNSDYNDFKTPCFCCLFRSTPRLEDLTGFRKSVGVRCEKYGKLSEFHGFTVCRNPHINISATEEEKEMLYERLTLGVILP